MRFLNTKSLELSGPYTPSKVPDYAILSHRWNTEEVTFADISKAPISELQSETRIKNGFAKIQGACKLALQDGYAWIWIDSCCIDKSSSAELQEAINSMWRYYRESNICYAYMADVPDSDAGWGQMFTKSEWFTRGWSLQELIAPACVVFYAHNWEPIGTKLERYEQIAEITSIDPDVLRNHAVDLFSTAEKLSWAAHRKVTREEDEAYWLLGLFYVNMPLLYGEGREKAFVRLQEAIYNSIADHSIFLFRHSLHVDDDQPLLADSPTRFCDRSDCTSCLSQGIRCLPSNIRYTNIISTERWRTEGHEQIMTTVTMFRNEMSTVLPLLNYRDISNNLEYFDNEKPRASVNSCGGASTIHWTNTRTAPYVSFCVDGLGWTDASAYRPPRPFCLILGILCLDLKRPSCSFAQAESIQRVTTASTHLHSKVIYSIWKHGTPRVPTPYYQHKRDRIQALRFRQEIPRAPNVQSEYYVELLAPKVHH